MEEESLLKERLQALTDKRKTQEDIANNRREIDEEKFKLEYIKKKALRDQWLISEHGCHWGQEAARLQMQAEQEQTRILQSNIHRMEKEVEGLERQEMIISKNEGLILKKLQSLERSTEDIIKAAKAGTLKETAEKIYISQSAPGSSKSPKMKKHCPDLQHGVEHLTSVRTEVGRESKTSQSHVWSAATIVRHRGAQVYNNGRKSAHTLSSDVDSVQNGVEQLSPKEVEQLMRLATPWDSRVFPECSECLPPSPHWKARSLNPDQIQNGGGHCQGGKKQVQTSHVSPCCTGTWAQQQPQNIRQNAQHSLQNIEKQLRNVQSSNPHESRTDFHINSCSGYKNVPPYYTRNFKADQLSSTPAYLDPSKPVTMIFMGYQQAAEDDGTTLALGYNGVIQAELVVITSDDDTDDHRDTPVSPSLRSPQETQHLPVGNISFKRNVSSSLPSFQEAKPKCYPNVSLPDRSTDKPAMIPTSNKGRDKSQKRAKHCCSLM